MVNENIKPRALTEAEREARKKGEYDSFANYLVFCGKCGRMAKTNIYIMRAEEYADILSARREKCPACGAEAWTVGYPANSDNGFVKF
ncbi:MAG: hypothetical protein RR314_06000 [Oscillospiraceae bacterium]